LLPWTWGQLALAGVMVVLAVLAMRSCWADWLNLSWHIEEHSHVFLVVPFGAWIIYANREQLREVKGGVSWVGPLIVLAGWGLAWEGYNDAHESFWHMGAVLVALGAGVTILGPDVVRRFWPAFLLLAFMVPMPSRLRLQIAQPLQTAMAATASSILSFFGEPVGRHGNSVTVNGQDVLIVEACNGLRMVFTLILVSWLFAFVTPLKNWVRWLIILLSPVTALVCNVIRLIPTLLMFGHASKESADRFHEGAGWAMVLLAFVLLMGVISLLEALGVEVRAEDAIGKRKETDVAEAGVMAGVAS
jgi:exosortase